MIIEVKGRNVPVTDELREHVERRCRAIERQVSELARLDVELSQERARGIPKDHVAEVTLHLKGVTLRARDASPDVVHSVNLACDELARQVKRHREKRRGRRKRPAPPVAGDAAPAPAEGA